MSHDPNRNKLFHDIRDYRYIKLTSKYHFLDLFCLSKPKFAVIIPETVILNMQGGTPNPIFKLFISQKVTNNGYSTRKKVINQKS
jgi:hypothetical protein